MAANKITVAISLTVAGTGFSAKSSGGQTYDQQGTNFTHETQTFPVAPAAAQLDVGPAIVEGKLGYLHVVNKDAANDLHIATDEAMTNVIATIAAGKDALIPPPNGTISIFGQGVNGPVQAEFLAVEA